MFCRKCGRQIPDDSDFCPKCGTQNCVEIDADRVNLKKTESHSNSSLATRTVEMVCRNCGNKLSTAWEKCPWCDLTNPFYIPSPVNKTSSAKQSAPPPPQVIIKEERIIVKEEKKEEEKGCGTMLGEAIGGFLLISFLIGMLQSCGICAG